MTRRTRSGPALLELPARAGGRILATAVGAMSVLRRAPKPLHPKGEVVNGVVRRRGGSRPSGVAWLDEPGEDPALVRLSRAVGLPARLPDIHGLALRLAGDQGPSDLLLATTGLGRITRFVLTPSRGGEGQALTSLLPYRTPGGPVLIGAVRIGDDTFDLRWATPSSEWTTFGRLELAATPAPDALISFDPVLHRVPGMDVYPWVRQLREPAYRTARRRSGRLD